MVFVYLFIYSFTEKAIRYIMRVQSESVSHDNHDNTVARKTLLVIRVGIAMYQ